ncbi:MAG: LamG domain-containing protein [Alphaproteobacteria bacterium]|nr:LamG domain-containing protein [Alphaproteobacteria bacterium]
MRLAVLLGVLAISTGAAAAQTAWKFNNLSRIGGIVPKVEGAPQLVDSPVGKAVQFNGADTALFFPSRPLVGAKTFTIEAIIRPEGGALEQRWMHIAETDPKTGLDANPNGVSDPNPRFMFEVRQKDGQWWLDAFVNSASGSKALIDPTKTHPANQWYAVAQSYDGKTYRSYVNGVLEGEADVAFTPHGAGHMMVGVRMNHVNWFKGSVAEARFTDHALSPREFLKVP